MAGKEIVNAVVRSMNSPTQVPGYLLGVQILTLPFTDCITFVSSTMGW